MAYTTAALRELVKDAARSARLTAWERGFMENVESGVKRLGDGFQPSAKQVEVLNRIEKKLYST